MADERLRLVAEVTDQFTAPLGRMETALRRTGNTARETAGQVKRDWEPLQGAIGKTTSVLQGMLSPLTALGTGSLAAGLGVTGMLTALRGFSTGARDVAIMARETGLAIDQLRAFGRLGEDFGVSAQTMQGGVKNFSNEMDRLRKRYGETYSTLQAMKLGDLVEKLVDAPNMKVALEAAMEALGNISNPVQRRKVAEMLFGTDQIGIVADGVKGKFRDAMKEIIADIGSLDAETAKKATEFEKHMGRIGDAAERLKLKVLGPMVKGIVGIIDDADKSGLAGNEEERAMRDLVSPQGPGDPNGAVRDRLLGRRNQIQQQLDLLNRNPNAPDYGRRRDRMVEELRRVADELERLRNHGATVQQQSFGGGGGALGGGSLIHKAGWGGLGGGIGGPGLGGFGGPLPTLGGGYGGGGSAGGIPTPTLGTGFKNGVGSSQAGRAGAGGPLPGIPDNVPMTAAERNTLGLIMKHESGGRNVMNYVGRSQGLDPNTAKGYTAQGYFQMLNSNWRRIAPQLGIATSNAMASSLEDQTRVALHLLRNGGIRNWSNYNPGLRAALARGDQAPAGMLPQLGDSAGKAATEQPWYERPRSNAPGQMSRLRDDEIEVPGSADRPGDRMMRRFYGDEAPTAKGSGTAASAGKGTLHIEFQNAPSGLRPRASMDDLFKDVKISKSRQMDMTSI